MAFKFAAFFALVAVAAAAPQHYDHYSHQPAYIKSYQPVVKQIVQPVLKKIVEHEEPANYDFEYAVHDGHTGDVKEQHESAKDGVVSGYYSLVDADGHKRIVHYTADPVHGFNAEVRREPLGHQVVKNVQPVVVKKVIAQPAIAVLQFNPQSVESLAVAASAAPQHYDNQHYEQPDYVKSYQPVVKHIVQPVLKKVVEHEEPANYDFEYAVHDDHTGDIKEHHESAKNGAVEGYYTLIDADGYRRIVHYTADDAHGFVAEVRREKIEGHQVVKNVQPVVVKKVIAQPAIAVQKYVAPAPVHQYYSAPETQYYKTEVQQPQQYYKVAAPVKVSAPKSVVADGLYTHVSFKGPSSQYQY
ncbi:CLUMA_CG013835, isoform A [Clunio marinus]|uniref:CLUMA_CG013835, isoform A n=1 Tax=Clunio marinus TaxID=568069 RepID=A0A1J1IK10_9DIPT|nr:CLUMA_CG013835, isoform A [Clunio marinus]